MTRPITIIRHTNGPRLYVARLRVHHGFSGLLVALTGLLTGRKAAVAAGVAMMAHDGHDWRVWLRVEKLAGQPSHVRIEAEHVA